jgi:hypothetical protein
MKTFLSRLALLCTFAGMIAQSRAVTFTVTPTAVSNTYNGAITLQVTGLASGDTVFVQKFLDASRNGVVDAGDLMIQAFKLTDGHAAVFQDGTTSVTNMNVHGDMDSTPGQITDPINLAMSGFEQTIVANYLIVLSSPSGNFSPQTNSFAVTNFPFAQSLSGTVSANGTNVPNAVVLLFQSSGNDMTPQGGVEADNSGNYHISAPPGNYAVVAFESNFVANTGAASVTLNNGVNLSTNLFLTSADRSISGNFIDASNSTPILAGTLVPVQTKNGLLTVAFTDTNGNFTAGVTGDSWKIEVSDQAAAFHNYLRSQNKVPVDTTGGSVSGVTIALPKATALFYGSVKDGLNQAMPGISLISSDNNNGWEQDVTTDPSGNYFSGALGSPTSAWQMQIGNNGNPPNYDYSVPPFDNNMPNGTNLVAGQALRVNFVALLATNHITGHVQDSTNHAVAIVQVAASATINGTNFQTQTDTDDNGNYSLNVANGNWSVSVNCQGGQDSLDNIFGNGTYQCPGNQNVNIVNNNGTANFTVQPCAGIQVLTPSPLPNGQMGTYYSIQLSATSCNGNFNWSLNSGTLPPGLTLYSGGPINGTPTANGTFLFTVHVSDGSGTSTNQNYSLTINAPTPPELGQSSKSGSQFRFFLSGSSGQNYTIQASTNLISSNWATILITNSPVNNTFMISDPNATNPARYYRVLLGP